MTAPVALRPPGRRGETAGADDDGPPVGCSAIDDDLATDPVADAEAVDPSAPSGPTLGLVLGGLAALWGLLIGLTPLHDNSFLTHLATGRLMLEQGGIPRADPYSFTAHGSPWVVQSWLASLIYASAERIAGLGGIRALQGALGAALAVAVWVLTSRSASALVRALVTAVVLVAGAELWTGRPLLFGLLGLAAVLLVADGHLDPRWLVPVGWVWVNTHGSFPYALLVLGLLAVGTRLDTGSWGREVRALRWAALGLALGALNPLGPRLLAFPLTVGDKQESFRAVAEWQPPAWETLGQVLTLVVLLVGILGLVRRPSWRDGLVMAAFAGLALTAARNGAPFLLVAAPILAGTAPDVGPRADLRRPVLRPALAAVVVLAVVFTATSLSAPPTSLDAFPVEQTAWMDARGMWGPTSRVLAPDRIGNLRTFTDGEAARVFIDDRVDMYPVELVRDYRRVLRVEPGWQDVLRRHRITAVLWPADSPLAAALAASPEWSIGRQDSLWVVAIPESSL